MGDLLKLLFGTINILFHFVSAEFDSYEVKQLEITPIYDIILFNDIADVIKDFDNDLASQAQPSNESDSDENIEDLLMEYQQYLDKAHKQGLDYLQKVSTKNKVPLLRNERYTKKNPKANFDDYYRPFANSYQQKLLDLTSYRAGKKGSKLSYTTSRSNTQTDFTPELATKYDHKTKSNIQSGIKSSCYCKANEIPCNCACKQCIIQYDSTNSNLYQKGPQLFDNFLEPLLTIPRYQNSEDDLKIQVKVDVKLPKILERLVQAFSKKDNSFIHPADAFRRETAMSYLAPFHVPIPRELFSYNAYNTIPQMSKSVPVQKITIHRKKKSRNNNNKKHKKTTLNIPETVVDRNTTVKSNISSIVTNQNRTEIPLLVTNNVKDSSNSTIVDNTLKQDNNKSKEFIYLTLNISSDSENHTDDGRLENSIETEYFKTKDNYSTIVTNVREKREIIATNDSTSESLELSVKPLKVVNETHDKKFDKLLDDPALLYWSENKAPIPRNSSKNINSVIENIEKRKSKFNMSRENIRVNHSIALEKAIFGDVDWNDMDTVAPVFMSFVGKYVRGVLTFCSDTVCHSMKCGEKSCIHRKCDPINRYNNQGHCLGSNGTDSTAKMESIMNLPSNLAFEIVDILQDKMLGKMYGKMTICICLKCSTFVASKKTVVKSKCTSKELNTANECPINKQH
ncbi:unnamed protein product [Leptosia nina]|uniref:Uncharacterized protein n=1 Tax=Leptosia nina TaxID=320188 RepID=A0AAV1JQM7_9NEOP